MADSTAFAELYASTAPAVRRYLARRLTRDTASVDDVLADTYLVAWRRRRAIPAGAELPWLYGVARRCLANHLRGAARRRRLLEKLQHTAPAAELPPPELADEALAAALAQISPIDREILLLVGWEGLTPSEAAAALGIAPEAARTRLARARTRCAALLEATGAPET